MASSQKSLSVQLEIATNKAMNQLGTWLDGRFTEEISSAKWAYPTPPEVRDIVDTGRLRASQTRKVNADGSVTFTWPIDYAQQVHEGGIAITGMRFPGRPWTKVPLEEAYDKFGKFLRSSLEEQQ
jgi:hypothetical protein